MSELTRAKRMVGRKRRLARLAESAIRDHANPERLRPAWAQVDPPNSAAPTGVRTTPDALRPGEERATPTSDGTERDDAELEIVVRLALSSTYFPLRTVVVVVTAGRVILIGRIASFYLKQVAQETARRVAGVAGFENRLVVDSCTASPARPDESSGPNHPVDTSGPKQSDASSGCDRSSLNNGSSP